jgi:hypothetical protein
MLAIAAGHQNAAHKNHLPACDAWPEAARHILLPLIAHAPVTAASPTELTAATDLAHTRPGAVYRQVILPMGLRKASVEQVELVKRAALLSRRRLLRTEEDAVDGCGKGRKKRGYRTGQQVRMSGIPDACSCAGVLAPLQPERAVRPSNLLLRAAPQP